MFLTACTGIRISASNAQKYVHEVVKECFIATNYLLNYPYNRGKLRHKNDYTSIPLQWRFYIVRMWRCIWSNSSIIQAKKEELTSTTSLPKSSRLYPSKLYSILWISCIFMASSWDLLSSLMLWAQSVMHCSDVVMVSRPNVSSGKCFCKFYNHGDE